MKKKKAKASQPCVRTPQRIKMPQAADKSKLIINVIMTLL